MITSELLIQFEPNWDSALLSLVSCLSSLIKKIGFIVHLQRHTSFLQWHSLNMFSCNLDRSSDIYYRLLAVFKQFFLKNLFRFLIQLHHIYSISFAKPKRIFSRKLWIGPTQHSTTATDHFKHFIIYCDCFFLVKLLSP